MYCYHKDEKEAINKERQTDRPTIVTLKSIGLSIIEIAKNNKE